MRRADRLFDIIELLRGRGVVRARDIAAALEVSERTIYRDMASLIAAGLPIDGEAGVGYLLRDGFDLPPLMFDEDEIEALVLGLRIVAAWADPALTRAADRALAKVSDALPGHLREHAARVPLDAPARHHAEPLEIDLAALRAAIRGRQKVAFGYTDLAGRQTTRTLCPLLISFFGPVWTLTGWCELRGDFRMFRIDRIRGLTPLEARFGTDLRHRLEQRLAEERRSG
ncbi:YafY family protein [Paralimibaculum aggregatum]|uniref:YafY family protein n=1 Tax=Paralimibaculum aggregatum TaxID=3036245 RepID=A0ABQ6LQ80_9RHOB|nr:YafY family protein [Limibaculum sp. NKW23]GMG84067.1 YafY family protein [Limibaculum sp. NKW23]